MWLPLSRAIAPDWAARARLARPVLPVPGGLALLFYATAALVAMLTLIALAAVALAGGGDRPPDPLAPYFDVLPGHERSAVMARGFACQPIDYPIEESCASALAAGAYSHIYATIYKGAISGVSFVVRDGVLRVGDLPASWGRPGVRVDGQFVYLTWEHANALAQSASGRFTYFLPVLRLSFADRDSPHVPRRVG